MATLTAVASKAITANAGKKAKVVSPAVALRLGSQRKWTVKYFKQKVGGKPRPHLRGRHRDRSLPGAEGHARGLLPTHAVDQEAAGQDRRAQAASGTTRSTTVWPAADAPTTTTYSVDKQQAYVIRTYVLSAAAKMQRTYWLGWFSTDTMAVKMADSSGAAAAARPSPTRSSGRGSTGPTSGAASRRRASGRARQRRARRLAGSTGSRKGKTTIKTPRSTRRVENQEGGVDASRGSRKRIRVDYRPVMVASRK